MGQMKDCCVVSSKFVWQHFFPTSTNYNCMEYHWRFVNFSFSFIYIYHITGNFCSVKFLQFWSEKKTFNFCGFFFLRIENLSTEKKNCLYYKKQQQKRCYDKQLVHITVILRSKNILNSLESFQRLQLLNTHLVNFELSFHLFRDLFCWQEIRSQQLDQYR